MHAAFSHWSASWPVILCYAALACVHVAGLRRVRGSAGTPQARRRQRDQALVFHGGLALALLALVSPLGYWSTVYLWARGAQFLLLALVSTGLIVLGAPWAALRAGFARGAGPGAPGQGLPQPAPGSRGGTTAVPWLIARPAVAVVAADLVWLAWQVPALADAARGSVAVAEASHVSYLAAGLVFWLQLIGSSPLSPAMSPLRRVRLVVGTAAAFTIFGMLLAVGSSVLYPAYAGAAHHVMTVLDDQQLSGAVLWMGSLLPLTTAAVALLLHWLNEEESAELTAGLDRLLTPRKDAWSVRPGMRRT